MKKTRKKTRLEGHLVVSNLDKPHPVENSSSKKIVTSEKPAVNVYKSKWRNRVSILFGVAMIIDGAFSLIYGSYASRQEIIPYIVIWALGPPIYFVLEYQLLFDNWEDKEKVEHLRHMQGLAEKIWAAVLFLLVLFYFHQT